MRQEMSQEITREMVSRIVTQVASRYRTCGNTPVIPTKQSLAAICRIHRNDAHSQVAISMALTLSSRTDILLAKSMCQTEFFEELTTEDY
jgi:hypothetical protein